MAAESVEVAKTTPLIPLLKIAFQKHFHLLFEYSDSLFVLRFALNFKLKTVRQMFKMECLIKVAIQVAAVFLTFVTSSCRQSSQQGFIVGGLVLYFNDYRTGLI